MNKSFILYFLILKLIVFNIHIAQQKNIISHIKWIACGNCDDSISGTKEIFTTCRLVKVENATKFSGGLIFSIPFDDSLMIDWSMYKTDNNQKLTNVKFRRACSDSILYIGGKWRDMWENMPRKCPISKGTYKLGEIDPSELLKQQVMFLPPAFNRYGFGLYAYGKFFKKRTGMIVGCTYVSFKLE